MSKRLKTFREYAIVMILFPLAFYTISRLVTEDQIERIAISLDFISWTVAICGVVWLYSLKYQYPDAFKKTEKTTSSQPAPQKREPEEKTISSAEKAVNAELWSGKSER